MVLNLFAVLAMVPAMLQPLRQTAARDMRYWLALALAVIGPTSWVVAHNMAAWRTGLAATLWMTIAATMALFAPVAWASREAWRLTPLLVLYLLCLSAVASIWHGSTVPPLVIAPGQASWVYVHIVTAVVTYGLVTIAAIAALAAFLQDRALKRKRPTALTRLLPSIADCESLLVGVLAIGEAVLALGLFTGMALEYRETGYLLPFTHKTVLTISAFVVIGSMLLFHRILGLRGRRAARIVLIGYLLLTLGYPGVKFVTDVLMPRHTADPTQAGARVLGNILI
jgi:ABC-type uncharacterized transport system permease subunit